MRNLKLAPALIALALLPLAYALLHGTAAAQPQADARPTLIINLTSGTESLHAVAMGLHFAEHGLAAGRQVVVFFNVKSPPLARKDLPAGTAFRNQPPLKETIAKLQADGARMVVCPMCAEAMGVTSADLAPGIEMIADRSQIFDHMHANTVVFTY